MQKDGSFLVLFNNKKKEKVFLVRRDDYYIWVIPGGGVEKGERPKEAAIREAVEETGFKIKLTRTLGVYQILGKEGKKLRKTYLYEGRVVSGVFKPEFPGCKGKWFHSDRPPLNALKSVKTKILDAKAHKSKIIFRKSRKENNIWENFHLLFVNPIGAIKYLVIKKIKKAL